MLYSVFEPSPPYDLWVGLDGNDELSCVQHADCKTGAQVVRCHWNGGHDYPSWGNEDVFWPFLKANPAVSK